jgi:hypothetical protein
VRCDKTRGTLGRLSAAPADGSRGSVAEGSRGVASRTRGRGLLLLPLLADILKSQCPDILTIESHYQEHFSEFVPPIAVVRVGAASTGAGEISLLCAGILWDWYRWCQDNTLLRAGISAVCMSVDQRRRLQSAHRRGGGGGWHAI